MGQLAFFIEFLTLTGLWERWKDECPLNYTSPNAPEIGDVLGTWLLSILSGHRRYAHVTAIRCDGVNPDLLGMNRIISIDDSPIKICVVTADEEIRIARETDSLVSQL